MLRRLASLMLALATALVFSGRMEAAAQHCARLAAAEAAHQHEAPPAEPSCHGVTEEAAAPTHHAPAHHSPTQPADHCECIAGLKGCMELASPTASARIEPYAWLEARAVSFASSEPSPGWRPPRA
jgi:hypothetical protein